MRELRLSFALCLLALASPALANDGYYNDYDPVIPYAVLEQAQEEKAAAAAPTDGAAAEGWGFAFNRGAFFGMGDPEAAYGQLELDRSALNHFTSNIDSEEYRDFSAAFFSGLAYQAIDPDQIYGPLWGVPTDAVGLEGYTSLTLEQLAAQKEFLPEELQAWLETHEVAAEEAETDADAGEGEKHEGGLDLATDDWG